MYLSFAIKPQWESKLAGGGPVGEPTSLLQPRQDAQGSVAILPLFGPDVWQGKAVAILPPLIHHGTCGSQNSHNRHLACHLALALRFLIWLPDPSGHLPWIFRLQSSVQSGLELILVWF